MKRKESLYYEPWHRRSEVIDWILYIGLLCGSIAGLSALFVATYIQ